MDDYLGRAHIAASARKHGVTDEDIRHALGHYWLLHGGNDLRVVMYIGPTMSGQPLEVGVMYGDLQPVVIHAMPARRKYLQARRRG